MIKGSDFAEACQRFFDDGNSILLKELGIKPAPPLPPPSPEVQEIMQGLANGWKENRSINDFLAKVEGPKVTP